MPDIATHAKQTAQTLKSQDWIELSARAGYTAIGVVYLLVGVLALLTASGYESGTPGSRGALSALFSQPFGMAMLSAMAIGLIGYVVWCFVQAIWDPERRRNDGSRLIFRASRVVAGLAHASLAFYAIALVTYTAGGSDDGLRNSTAKLMSYPGGIAAVGIVGLITACAGAYQLYKAYHVDLDDQLRLYAMGDAMRRVTRQVGRGGIAARGLIFVMIGGFLVVAAYKTNPAEAKGLGEALNALRQQPYGAFLLAAVAVGLMAYGAYQLILAAHRRIETS